MKGSVELLSRVDHLLYATPDLNRGVEEIEKLIGVRATEGGQHPGRGTRNALPSSTARVALWNCDRCGETAQIRKEL